MSSYPCKQNWGFLQFSSNVVSSCSHHASCRAVDWFTTESAFFCHKLIGITYSIFIICLLEFSTYFSICHAGLVSLKLLYIHLTLLKGYSQRWKHRYIVTCLLQAEARCLNLMLHLAGIILASTVVMLLLQLWYFHNRKASNFQYQLLFLTVHS